MSVELAGDGAPPRLEVDQLLVAVGRRPNTDDLGLEHTRAARDARGFIVVDAQRRTGDPRVFAIGDAAGEPMLAHKAMAEGLVAAAAVAGRPAAFEPQAVPAVVFTDPEVAWCGLTEAEARGRGVEVRAVKVPWSASGRAVAMGRADGLTKLVFEAGVRAPPRRRPGRPACRRPPRRGHPGPRDGRRGRGPGRHDPHPPHAVRDAGRGGRALPRPPGPPPAAARLIPDPRPAGLSPRSRSRHVRPRPGCLARFSSPRWEP